ncbi:MAG: XRE family transcriptional regulator [Bacteroidales bacterium]|nr:XRE family transcriptional regulator [Bacteroidales bacterium]
MDDKKQHQKELHIGKLIKSELSRQGRSITWLSTQVNCSRENLYKVFRRSWIYTDLLFEISKALDYDFFKECSEFYKRHKDVEI